MAYYEWRPYVSVAQQISLPSGHIQGQDRSHRQRHRLFEPLDFIARLAALVPRPRAHLLRYHGLFAPPRGPRTPPSVLLH